MDANVRDAVTEKLSSVLSNVESEGGLSVGAGVRSFLTNFVMESLEVRQNEWTKRGLDPNKPDSSWKIASVIEEAVRSTTQTAEIYKSATGSRQVLLIGVVEQVHNKWCGIFPFCR